MTLENLSPDTRSFFTPRFVVDIEGQPLAEAIAAHILEVWVFETVDEGASFRIVFHNKIDPDTQEYTLLDASDFSAGNVVTVQMGYDNAMDTVVMGKITKIESSFFVDDMSTFCLEGHDLSYDYIKRSSPERTFVDMTYGDIARTVASEAGLQAVVDETGLYKPSRRKANGENYFTFLERLAGEVGYRFDIDRQTLYFRRPEDEEQEILSLVFGKDLVSFQPILNTARLYTSVEVRGHNPSDPATPIVGIAAAGDERGQESGKATGSQLADQRHGEIKKVISGVVVYSVAHAEEMARSALNEASDTLIQGCGECVGLPQIRKGVNIRIENLGARFSGKYYVTSTTHTINADGYTTLFEAKRNAV